MLQDLSCQFLDWSNDVAREKIIVTSLFPWIFSCQKGQGSVLFPEFVGHQRCAYTRDSIRKNLSFCIFQLVNCPHLRLKGLVWCRHCPACRYRDNHI